MSTRAHVLVVIVTAVAIAFIFRLLRTRQIRSKYVVLWLGIAIILTPLALVPQSLESVSHWVGVEYPPAVFLFFASGTLFLVAVHFSWELSRLESRTRALAERLALLKAALEEHGISLRDPIRDDDPGTESSIEQPR